MAAYGTLSAADAYHLARGNAGWAAGSTDARTAALLRGSEYVDGRYRWLLASGVWRSLFRGKKAAGRDQVREWPRVDATDYEGVPIPPDEVPIEVEHAAYEAALIDLNSPGSLSPVFVSNAQRTRTKVGPIDVGYAVGHADRNHLPNRPIYPWIDEILAPLLRKPAEVTGIFVV